MSSTWRNPFLDCEVRMSTQVAYKAFLTLALMSMSCGKQDRQPQGSQEPSPDSPEDGQTVGWDAVIEQNLAQMAREGKDIFRHDTFGSEAFWSGQLQLNLAVLGQGQGGVGPGLAPADALAL